MSKAPAYDIGRIFFQVDDDDPLGIPTKLRVVPLDCHVNNVAMFARHWIQSSKLREFEHKEHIHGYEGTHSHVISAAERHDQAKPECFKIKYEKSKFIYSFAGHRFRVPPKEPYEDALIRGHHDFSVPKVVEAAYHLRTQLKEDEGSQLSGLATQHTELLRRYRDDLYILEMSDQIEASLETALLDWKPSETRNFMDFHIEPPQWHCETQRDKADVSVEPFSWSQGGKDVLEVTYTYQDIDVSFMVQHALRCILDEWREELDKEKETSHKKPKESEKLAQKASGVLQDFILRSLKREAIQSTQAWIRPRTQSTSRPTQSHCKTILGFEQLNPMQQEVSSYVEQNHQDGLSLLLRSPTGSGKTEAVLWPCLKEGRRLFLVLPTRSLLEDHQKRIASILKQAASVAKREYTLIIDTGTQRTQYIFDKDGMCRKGNRRHLYRADVILTTLDKLTYRFFGFHDPTKSMVYPHRLEQSNVVYCFDEAHSYDGLVWNNFKMLIQTLYRTGSDLILMTATMPQQLVETFEDFDVIDFCEGQNAQKMLQFSRSLRSTWSPEKQMDWKEVDYEPQGAEEPDFEFEQRYEDRMGEALYEQTLEALHAKQSKIIVIANTVRTAIRVFEQLQESPEVRKAPHTQMLYHGRLASHRWKLTGSTQRERVDSPRETIYKQLKTCDDSDERPYLLVTTHAIEVGCDLDASCLITALCTPDALIQRAGRCNRRQSTSGARIIVLGDYVPSYLQSVSSEQHMHYVNALREASGRPFEAITYQPFLNPEEQLEDPRQIELFEMMYEYVYKGNIEYEAIHKRGLLAIRSWEPSITIRCHVTSQHKGQQYNFMDELSIPIGRLRIAKDASGEYVCKDDALVTYEKKFDKEKKHYKDSALTYGDVYRKREIIVEITQGYIEGGGPDAYYTELTGLHTAPRVFRMWQHRDTLKTFAQDLSYPKEEGQKGAVIHFMSPYTEEFQ